MFANDTGYDIVLASDERSERKALLNVLPKPIRLILNLIKNVGVEG